jgi:hypothetical protein
VSRFEKEAARAVLEVIQELEKQRELVPSSEALNKPKVRQAIVAQVKERLTPVQGELLETESVDLDEVVAKITGVVARETIDIPRIAVVPTGGGDRRFRAVHPKYEQPESATSRPEAYYPASAHQRAGDLGFRSRHYREAAGGLHRLRPGGF